MKHIVLGTAGHVDHGKTSLVKALTDVDTDRLKEEKERGITIDLGFAPLKLDDETFVGIVDVPGHERFVKNMVAGAAGIDMVVLVIASDEGVMPQTREHLHVCDLLNVKRGLVAVTKTDLVDGEWLSMVIDDIRGFLAGSFLEGAPIVPLSSHSGSGISDFINTLRRIVSEDKTVKRTDFFRLPVDRIFTMKGFGTVVTGTLVAGKVAVGDTVTILPSSITTKVRGLQVHNESRVFAEPGFRTAINFQGLGREAICRGDIIAHPDIFEPSQRMDIFLRHLPGAKRKLKHRAPVRFHAGTSEIMARLHFPDREELEAGAEAYAQVILEKPTVAMAGDHFVIRSYSPATTIGGGRILDPMASKVKRLSPGPGKAAPKGIEEMKSLHSGSAIEITETILRRSGLEGISLNRLAIRTGISLSDQQTLMEEMLSRKKALMVDREDRRAIAWETYEEFTKKMLDIIDGYHERFPLKKGLAKEELRISLGARTPVKLFHKALMDMETGGLVSLDREMVARSGYDVRLGKDLEGLKDEIIRRYMAAGLAPPSTKEVVEGAGTEKAKAESVLKVLLDQGLLLKLNDDMYFERGSIERLRSDYRTALVNKETFTPADFKELTGLSRKFIIPLMEYFDKTNLTIRVGNGRILRESEKK